MPAYLVGRHLCSTPIVLALQAAGLHRGPVRLGQERDHFVKNLHHANGGAGISAFLEKRVPRYE